MSLGKWALLKIDSDGAGDPKVTVLKIFTNESEAHRMRTELSLDCHQDVCESCTCVSDTVLFHVTRVESES